MFHPKGYTNSGNYQVPMFQFPVNVDLLNDINKSEEEEVWAVVQHYLSEKKISFMGYSSIFCRLLDC